jgi:polar amino acid transport system substrate-binding protein
MRVSFGLLTFLVFFLSGQVFSAQNVTITTYDDDPPYAFNDEQGNHIYIEIVRKAVSNMPGYTVNFEVAPWARSKKLVEFGDAFAILAPYFHAHDWLTKTEPKRPYIWPYSRRIDVVTS